MKHLLQLKRYVIRQYLLDYETESLFDDAFHFLKNHRIKIIYVEIEVLY